MRLYCIGGSDDPPARSAQQAPANSSSLFALASVLASKSKEDGPGVKTTMLPFLPQRQPSSAQTAAESASEPTNEHRSVSAASAAPESGEPAAEPAQQAAEASASKPVYATATFPTYEPGFLTRPFRQASHHCMPVSMLYSWCSCPFTTAQCSCSIVF